MWMLNNQTPMAAERSWVRDKNGAEVWLVAVKGTFDILPDGSTVLSDEQEEVILAPTFRGDPHRSSLLAESDLQHSKSATDVLVEGSAYAPGSKSTTKVSVGVNVASIRKILTVTGDRVWESRIGGVVPGQPERFQKIPIIYERAFGGMDLTSDDSAKRDWDRRNPAGLGFSTNSEHLIGKPVPNIEDPDNLLKVATNNVPTAGFGPIAGHWSPRVTLAGTYGKDWEKNRQPLVPTDFDDHYYQCAPVDQQVPGFLKGGEQAVLVNLTPAGRLEVTLPRLSLRFTTEFEDGSVEERRGFIHTVTFRPDALKVVLTWHMNLECHHKVLKLVETGIRVKRRFFTSERAKQSMHSF